MAIDTGRQTALLGFGSLALGATAVAASPAGAATSVRLIPAKCRRSFAARCASSKGIPPAPAALSIFERYGFKPYMGAASAG